MMLLKNSKTVSILFANNAKNTSRSDDRNSVLNFNKHPEFYFLFKENNKINNMAGFDFNKRVSQLRLSSRHALGDSFVEMFEKNFLKKFPEVAVFEDKKYSELLNCYSQLTWEEVDDVQNDLIHDFRNNLPEFFI